MSKFRIITPKDKGYPKLLKEIPDPPQKLWVRGEIKKEDEKAIAVVGARRATNYGREVTEELVNALVVAGLTIVSGMARGIDSCAHKAALEAGGRTIAVLGSGIDVIYPPENKKLYEEIAKAGAVISEFEPGTLPNAWNFPQRNRIIAGLSLGVLVCEAAEKSGSLITAGYAGEFGREVFAVPGPIYSKMSAGTAALIKDGAKLVYSTKDILDELGALPAAGFVLGLGRWGLEEVPENLPRKVAPDTSELKVILELLQDEPKHIDAIIKETGLSASKVSSLLSMAEIYGVVKHLGAGMYILLKTV